MLPQAHRDRHNASARSREIVFFIVITFDYNFIVFIELHNYNILKLNLSRYNYTITEVIVMAEEIKIKKKIPKRGDDGYKIVSVRMKDELIDKLDRLSADTNRSRNELINLLLEASLDIVKIEE